MPYAVELDFDDATTAAVAALTAEIYAHCGGMDLNGNNATPHISLAVFAEVDAARLNPLVAALAAQTSPFPLQFAAVGSFPGEQGVVYLAPVVTPMLLAIHHAFHEQLAVGGLTTDANYQPGRWIPHCTVGFNLPPGNVGTAVAHGRQFAYFGQPALVSALRLINFRHVAPPPGATPTRVSTVTTIGHYPFQ